MASKYDRPVKASVDEFALRSEKGPVVRPPPHPLACATVDELLRLTDSLDTPLAADLFSGAGGFSLGLDEAGFTTVVGVDYDENVLETYRSLFAGLALQRDLSDRAAIDEIVEILTKVGITILVGGPPCQPFSRAGRATIRTLVEKGTRDLYDKRRDLWQSFLEIAERVRPRIVMMENVPDLALGDESRILRVLIERLESI
jgi:DNA (cytosine-5)-methyltransferase 1